jgi:hypothetical protein
MPFTSVEGDMGPEGRRELLIGKDDVKKMLNQIREGLASPLNPDPYPTKQNLDLAISLLKRSSNGDLVIGYGALENRKVRGAVLALVIGLVNTAVCFSGFNLEVEFAAIIASIVGSVGIGSFAMQAGFLGNRHIKFYATVGAVAAIVGFGIGYFFHHQTHNLVVCDSNYSGCVPVKSDIDCADLATPVAVTGVDVYALDRDGDGKACEWNQK